MLVLRAKRSPTLRRNFGQSSIHKPFTGTTRPLALQSSLRSTSQNLSYYSQFHRYTNHPRQKFCQYTTNAEPISFADPNRLDLFYHLIPPPSPYSSNVPAFALSFLPTPPSSGDSSTIIGWLPASSEGQEGEAGLNDFKENPKFRDILHKAVHVALREGLDDIWINGATQLQNGWMHIHDNRNVPALGRIGDPDDILASVLVEDGKILPDTYQAMPSYRFCTADGLIQLTDGLAKKLHAVLKEHADAEGTF